MPIGKLWANPNGWRFTDTEYSVFCDGRLVVDL